GIHIAGRNHVWPVELRRAVDRARTDIDRGVDIAAGIKRAGDRRIASGIDIGRYANVAAGIGAGRIDVAGRADIGTGDVAADRDAAAGVGAVRLDIAERVNEGRGDVAGGDEVPPAHIIGRDEAALVGGD